MPTPIQLSLSEAQRRELEEVRDTHPKPHMREKAAAVLKIAEGQSGLQVAHSGLLKKRDSDTVYRWVRRYEAEGINGLGIRPGRGRKAAFFPSIR